MSTWGTFGVAYLSSAESTAQVAKFQPVYEAAKRSRSEVLDAALFVESRLDIVLADGFCGKDMTRREFARAALLEPEFCTFHQKWRMLRSLFKSPALLRAVVSEEERKALLTSLQSLIHARNMFAHGDIYVDARDSRPFLKYFEQSVREQYIDEKLLSAIMHDAKACLLILERLIAAAE